jgi:SAM-dependent methyltransferase
MTSAPHETTGKSGKRPTAYRQRVLTEIDRVLGSLPAGMCALDFGAGDGWFARELARTAHVRRVIPADVRVWPDAITPSLQFDGVRLPFRDRAFDLVFAIDVIHHCSDPAAALGEALRCTGRYFLIKDHTYRNGVEWWALTVMDEIGNRRFGVPSRYLYQHRWSWNRLIERHGFELQAMIHPLRCHSGPLGALTNRLQFLALWRRVPAAETPDVR